MTPDELQQLKEERRALRQEHGNRLREVAHDAVDTWIREQLAQVDDMLRFADPTRPLDPTLLEAMTRTWALRDPKFGEMFHRMVDTTPADWSELSRGEYEQRMRKLDRAIDEGERDLKRQEIDERRSALETELAALED